MRHKAPQLKVQTSQQAAGSKHMLASRKKKRKLVSRLKH